MKQYGILKPKSLDFLLAIMFALVSASALWLGIWIAVTGSQMMAVEVLELMVKVLIGSFEGIYSWLILVESVVVYGALFGFCVVSFYEMLRKKFRTIAGLFAMLLFAVAFVMQLNFLIVYIFSGISGLLSVFLIVFMFCELYIAYLLSKLLYSMVIKQSAEYGKYKNEFGAVEAQPESKEEKPLVKKVEKEQPKPKLEPKVEPKVEEKEEPQKQEEDDFDFVFTNSNDYKEYMYHENVVKYMKEEEEKPVHKEEKSVNKIEEKEESKFAGKGNNYTFEQKLKLAKPYVRNYFKELTTYFVSLGFTPALTKQGETFSYKNNKCASITTAGKNGLKVYYKLDVKDYENSTIPVKFVGDVRKYEKTPLLFVAKSELAIKRAKKLMDDVKSKLN